MQFYCANTAHLPPTIGRFTPCLHRWWGMAAAAAMGTVAVGGCDCHNFKAGEVKSVFLGGYTCAAAKGNSIPPPGLEPGSLG